MSDEFNSYTRLNRFEKKRKNTKAISILSGLGGLFIIVLVGFFIFGGEDNKDQAQSAAKDNQQEENNTSETENQGDQPALQGEEPASGQVDNQEQDNGSDMSESEETDSDDQQVEIVQSTDENVIQAYKKDWQPIGTEQDGNHQFSWDTESQDWQELMRAVRVATGLSPDNMIEWWVDGNGEQKVIATVSNNDQTEIYRVYATWINEQGWQPTLVEELKENDKNTNSSKEENTEESTDDSESSSSTSEATDTE